MNDLQFAKRKGNRIGEDPLTELKPLSQVLLAQSPCSPVLTYVIGRISPVKEEEEGTSSTMSCTVPNAWHLVGDLDREH